MYPVPIEHYYRPSSVQEARELAANASGECFYVAGGMSLMQAVKSRMVAPDCLIDLNGIGALRGISRDGSLIRIGAMTRYREIADNEANLAPFNALSDAAAHVGDRQVRNRGTIGGSLSWNYVSACFPAAALACGAKIEILCIDGGTETITIDDFLVAPMMTALREGDLVMAMMLPGDSNAGGSAYKKWGTVTDALPVVGVAVYIEVNDAGRSTAARFVVGGLDSGPRRSKMAEAKLSAGVDVGDANALAACADEAAKETTTHGDHKVSAEYKTQLIRQLGTEVLVRAAQRARS